MFPTVRYQKVFQQSCSHKVTAARELSSLSGVYSVTAKYKWADFPLFHHTYSIFNPKNSLHSLQKKSKKKKSYVLANAGLTLNNFVKAMSKSPRHFATDVIK